MRTVLLDREAWDWAIDANGNIAIASDPYSQVQDAASSCRTFLGECFYNTLIGVPFFQSILGHFQPVQVMRASFEAAAFRVPGVTNVQVFLSGIVGRSISGQVQIQTADSQLAASF